MNERDAMRIILIKVFLTVFLSGILTTNADAKRLRPAEVNPVEKDGIQYRAPHWGNAEDKKQNGGYIEAWDIKHNKWLWSLRVFQPEINTAKERDVQDVFITSLAFMGNELHVGNEHGDVYLVDLKTRKTKKLAGASAPARAKGAP